MLGKLLFPRHTREWLLIKAPTQTDHPAHVDAHSAAVATFDSEPACGDDDLPHTIGEEIKIHLLGEAGRLPGWHHQHAATSRRQAEGEFVSSLAHSDLTDSSESVADQMYCSESSSSTPTSPDSTEVSRTDVDSAQTEDDTPQEANTDLAAILSKSARIRRREDRSRDVLAAQPFFNVAPSKRRKLKDDDCDYECKRKRNRKKKPKQPSEAPRRRRPSAPEPVYEVAPDFDKATWKEAASIVSWNFVEEAPNMDSYSMILSRSH